MPGHLPSIDIRGFNFKGCRSTDNEKEAANYQNYHLLPDRGAARFLGMGLRLIVNSLLREMPFLLAISPSSPNWIPFFSFWALAIGFELLLDDFLCK